MTSNSATPPAATDLPRCWSGAPQGAVFAGAGGGGGPGKVRSRRTRRLNTFPSPIPLLQDVLDSQTMLFEFEENVTANITSCRPYTTLGTALTVRDEQLDVVADSGTLTPVSCGALAGLRIRGGQPYFLTIDTETSLVRGGGLLVRGMAVAHPEGWCLQALGMRSAGVPPSHSVLLVRGGGGAVDRPEGPCNRHG